jgi:hypothetical protein
MIPTRGRGGKKLNVVRRWKEEDAEYKGWKKVLDSVIV